MTNKIASLILLILISLTITVLGETKSDPAFQILFINVGRADAALILSEDKTYLIDTGTKESAPALLSALKHLKVQKIDGLLITHTHHDHIGGALKLGENYPISQAYRAEFSETKPGKENKIDQTFETLKLPYTILKAGERIKLSEHVFADVLAPLVLSTGDDNDNSLVLKITVFNRTLLMTGDMQFSEENTILLNNPDRLRSEVLKVGNHGNPDATGEVFAKAVSPQYAICSTDTQVDRNSANPRVIQALEKAKWLVTENSDLGILMQTDENQAWILSVPKRQSSGLKAEITEIDVKGQSLNIHNLGESNDFSGCMLSVAPSGKLLFIPEGTMIASNQTLTISSIEAEGGLLWREKKIFSKKDKQKILLYDRFGNLLDAKLIE